jgi:hypothetical protein
VENTDVQCNTVSATSLSAEELEKQRWKENRKKFLDGIRDKLESVSHQLAYTVAEASVLCGRSPTWGYRKVYSGQWRVTNRDGRLLVPRGEIERDLGGAEKYNPQPKHPKNGGEGE